MCNLNPVTFDNTEEIARLNQDIAALEIRKETAHNAETSEGDIEEGRCKGLIRTLKEKKECVESDSH